MTTRGIKTINNFPLSLRTLESVLRVSPLPACCACVGETGHDQVPRDINAPVRKRIGAFSFAPLCGRLQFVFSALTAFKVPATCRSGFRLL